jgi:hypothetical protein
MMAAIRARQRSPRPRSHEPFVLRRRRELPRSNFASASCRRSLFDFGPQNRRRLKRRSKSLLHMPRPRPPHLHRQVTRHGKTVWYVRIDKGPRVRIRAEFGTPEFDAYRARRWWRRIARSAA